MSELLTRDQFRAVCLMRDGGKCICGSLATEVHHIVERRLWPDGGYYADNGASLCNACHRRAEDTTLGAQEIRDAIGIALIALPPHFEPGDYDKWGNPILSNGTRLRGELFEECKETIASSMLALFTDRVKYPRTFHLPWSPGVASDDKVIDDMTAFLADERVIVTRKLDGECTTFYNDGIHARSIDYHPHESRSWVKALHARIAADIPEGWRICGENVYAKHSIAYKNLASYFFAFSVWNAKNICLPWDETVEWCKLLELEHVPVLFDGEFRRWREVEYAYVAPIEQRHEGYVIRLARGIPYKHFRHAVAKYVRKNHVQTSEHWKDEKIVKNELAKELAE